MTKKDSTTATSATGGGDFFSDISDDLKTQINDFPEEGEGTDASHSTDEANAQLFAMDSSSSLSDLDEADASVFDTSSHSSSPPTHPDESSQSQAAGESQENKEMTPPDMEPSQAEEQATASQEEAVSGEAESSSESKSSEDTAPAASEASTAKPAEDSAEKSAESSPSVVVVQKPAKRQRTEDLGSPTAFAASPSGHTIEVDGETYTLHGALEEEEDRIVWRASRPSQGEQPPHPAHIIEMSPSRYRATYKHFPKLSSKNAITAPHVFEEDDRAYLVYPNPQGYCLAERIRDPQHHWTIQQMQGLMHQLGSTIAELHQAGHLFLQLTDESIWIQTDRTPQIHGIEQVYTNRTPNHLLPVFEGFSAPEVYHQHVPVGTYTDIFALGALLHYMISQCPPFNHLDLSEPYVPSLRVYQLDFPVGLDHVLFRACHPDTALRYSSVADFLAALDRAIAEIETRHRAPRANLQLSVAHDIHIGINKAQRNPTNQDALFWRFDKSNSKGLFVIADGVSHCHYGSGDRASSILIASAREHWNLLVQKDVYQQVIPAAQRRRFIQSIFDAANAAISREVNRLYERVDGYVEDVMGSTCVMAFLDGNEVTIANLGDSRSYLKTPYYIEQINVDHDYKTAQLQVGCDLRSIQNLMGASLITRCVGSCRKDEKLKVVPLKLQPDFFELKLKKNDILLLCSDGLSDYAGNTEAESRETIAKILDVHTEPISAVFWLVALANQRGGGDNISVIEIKVLDTVQ